MNRHVGCAAISQASGEQQVGKGGSARAWVLVELPGPWGSDPFEGRGASEALRRLDERLSPWKVRLLAIRRHGRPDGARPAASRTAFVCSGGSRNPWIERLEPADPEQLLALDPEQLCAGFRPELGEPHDEPIYLVCTHGGKDVCCAVRGRPVAKALSALRPGQTWESSHVGGDRFAPNLVCLPHGILYGHLAPETVGQAVEAYERGELQLDRLRGRSGVPPAAQAAEHLIRLRDGLRPIDAVVPVATTDLGEGRFDVELQLASGRIRATVRRDAILEPRRLTCAAGEFKEPPHWELVSMSAVVR